MVPDLDSGLSDSSSMTPTPVNQLAGVSGLGWGMQERYLSDASSMTPIPVNQIANVYGVGSWPGASRKVLVRLFQPFFLTPATNQPVFLVSDLSSGLQGKYLSDSRIMTPTPFSQIGSVHSVGSQLGASWKVLKRRR